MRSFPPRPSIIAAIACVAAVASGCRPPRTPSLVASPGHVAVPRIELPAEHRRVTFRWNFTDGDAKAQGEGVARIAPPDSARLDFFLDGGYGGGYAVLVGDTLSAPGPAAVRRILPPAPMMWAAFGRLVVPAARDTIARVDADTIRADIGTAPTWRATIADGQLVQLSRLDRGREVERLVRDGPLSSYSQPGTARSVSFTITRIDTVSAFDAAIWRP